jgi:hypothetical protein
MGEGYKVRAQTADDVEDGSVARFSFVKFFGKAHHLSVERRNGERPLLQSEAFDDLLDLRRNRPALASILAFLAGECRQAKEPILGNPSLRSSIRYARFTGNGLQRPVLLKVRLDLAEPIQGKPSGFFR